MRIGYYAHHHGSGHCRQADKLAALLPEALRQNLIVFTSLKADAYDFTTIADEQIIRLSPEDQRADEILPGRAGQHWQPDSLHYSPVGNSDIQNRSWQILNGINTHQIDLMIVDVSVEVAMLCRVASIPYLYVRLAGIRDDTPHLNAFAGALALLAPYPKSLEAAETTDWLKHKTLYLDFLPDESSAPVTHIEFVKLLKHLLANNSNDKSLNSITELKLASKAERSSKIITVIKGYGGHKAIDAKLLELRDLHPDAFMVSLGPIAEDKHAYVDLAAEVSDVAPFIEHSDLLLMACGLNGIAQAYYHKTPLVVLPDERPHREQEVMAESLIAQGRAMSWQQFVEQSRGADGLTTLPTKSNINEILDASETKANTQTVAQNFMDSFVEYDSTKSWFQQWLLPQLAITPER